MKRALIGAGGFATDIIGQMGPMVCFVDDEYYPGQFSEPDRIIYSLGSFDPQKWEVLLVIGGSIDRYNMVNRLPKETKYFSWLHPTTSKSEYGPNMIPKIGHGVVSNAGVIIMPNSVIGNHTVLNVGAIIGHDSIIGDFFTGSPGSGVMGNCKIGDRVFLGANSFIREGIIICDDVLIGMGSNVMKDIIESGVYVGTPAKKINRFINEGELK